MDFPLYFQILRGRVQGVFFKLGSYFFFAKWLVFTYQTAVGVPEVLILSSPLIVIPYQEEQTQQDALLFQGFSTELHHRKLHDATDFSHSTTQCESKNIWVQPNHLHFSLCFHLSVAMAIKTTKHNMLRKALSDGISAMLKPLYKSTVKKVLIVKWYWIQIFLLEVLLLA